MSEHSPENIIHDIDDSSQFSINNPQDTINRLQEEAHAELLEEVGYGEITMEDCERMYAAWIDKWWKK